MRFQSRKLFVGLVVISCLGCTDPDPGSASDTGGGSPLAVMEFDPFPADMDLWSCGGYLEALVGTPFHETLEEILRIRPHVYREPATRENLLVIDDDLILESRRRSPIYLHLIHEDVAESLSALVRAANAESLNLRVRSAFRSPAYQNYLWKLGVKRHESDLARAAFGVAPPCFSEHATGRAVDFSAGDDFSAFEGSPEHGWLLENGARWGWIQSFRDDNGAVRSADVEGIVVEPWHYHHVSLGGEGG